MNLLTTEDAIKGILLAAEHAGNAEVWNIGGASDYPMEEVRQVEISVISNRANFNFTHGNSAEDVFLA